MTLLQFVARISELDIPTFDTNLDPKGLQLQ
jgi:hypothetical protein